MQMKVLLLGLSNLFMLTPLPGVVSVQQRTKLHSQKLY